MLLFQLLAMGQQCNKLDDIQIGLLRGPEIRQLDSDYAGLYELISRETGLNMTVDGIIGVFTAQDILLCEVSSSSLQYYGIIYLVVFLIIFIAQCT